MHDPINDIMDSFRKQGVPSQLLLHHLVCKSADDLEKRAIDKVKNLSAHEVEDMAKSLGMTVEDARQAIATITTIT